MVEDDINILITGGPDSGKAVAAVLINKALADNGFSDVIMLSDSGKAISPIEAVPSILDVIKNGTPRLFETPVIVQEIRTKAPYFQRPARRLEPSGPILEVEG
jgi:hypothetical protein